ncbi:MAG TPA: BrnA antitoxin family protein [Candidatus Angelobacter sp.]|nr:BrnA antitoxin family protein [Candidatus Angelobacter sp.]
MKLTKDQAKQLRTLQRMKDEDIDLSDIPEKLDWSKAVVGKFYRPVKKSLTIRIDADVLAWVKSSGKGYQTRINAYLREAMNKTKKQVQPVAARKKKSAS